MTRGTGKANLLWNDVGLAAFLTREALVASAVQFE